MTALYELTGLGALYNAGIQWLATGIKLGLKKAGVELAKKEGVILADDAAGGISLTKHGAERLAGVAATRGGVLSIEEVKAIKLLVQKPIIQGDGAKVFIHEVTPGRFSGFIENQNTGKLITTMNNWSKKSINKMGKNHGWSVE
ncbi:hypothetical protein [Arundinibacter roseus]|uniref:Uncharacterized protein n=1 Tax=Arundinibacter roseus TaxID=2070510 RepID=A0A4R4KN67_9BACT|nr:hypothetical protein [Arundinibacter roseus]TDB67991.1 hypothetical protein EZE20_03435 [Arundinibacter roseus]